MVKAIRPLSECDMFIPGNTIAYWWDYEYHMAKYLFAAKYVQGKNILDIGCGVGYGSSYLLRHGAKKVVGIEINPEVVKLANKSYAKPGLEFLALDATFLPFADNSFDVVTSIGMLDHISDPRKVLLEMRRVLRNKGYFLCSVNNREFINLPFRKKSLDPFHHTEYNPSELSKLCSEYFTDIDLYGEKLSKTWFRLTSISSVVSRKFNLLGKINQRIGRMIFPHKLRPLVYSEEMIDVHFPLGSQFVPFKLKEQSRYSSFTVVCVKKLQ